MKKCIGNVILLTIVVSCSNVNTQIDEHANNQNLFDTTRLNQLLEVADSMERVVRKEPHDGLHDSLMTDTTFWNSFEVR